MNRAKTWILSFFAIEAAALLLLAAAAYLVDPFFQFRIKDKTYVLQEWFVSSGLIENYRYDTLLIGSSMTRNFDMNRFREKLGAEPLHIGLGGIRPVEINELVRLAYDSGKAEKYYICVDLGFFGNPGEESRYPRYLLKKDFLSHLRYLLSYEVWFRYIPIDLGLVLCDRLGVKIPDKVAHLKEIDRLGDWEYNYRYRGEAEVAARYKRKIGRVPVLETAGLHERLTAQFDGYLDRFDFKRGEHIFFLPPYSSLFWCDTQRAGYFDIYLRAREYFVSAAARRGAAVFDFQSAEFTTDLDNYRDIKHYRPEINDLMVDAFAKGEFKVTEESFPESQRRLIENTENFRKEHTDLFREEYKHPSEGSAHTSSND